MFNAAELVREAFFSFETWKTALPLLLLFAVPAAIIILVKLILKVLAHFIKKITR